MFMNTASDRTTSKKTAEILTITIDKLMVTNVYLPVIIDTRAEIPKLVRPKRNMANFNKANWLEFSDSIETKVACYAGPRDAYSLEKFLSATIIRAASKHIPYGKFTPTTEHPGDTKEIAELAKER
uniref:Uncharacterized protein n=1 Tax=Caenorhabditis japonica TaxID=281687 RepID=A0A8R1E4H6_CAEJA